MSGEYFWCPTGPKELRRYCLRGGECRKIDKGSGDTLSLVRWSTTPIQVRPHRGDVLNVEEVQTETRCKLGMSWITVPQEYESTVNVKIFTHKRTGKLCNLERMVTKSVSHDDRNPVVATHTLSGLWYVVET